MIFIASLATGAEVARGMEAFAFLDETGAVKEPDDYALLTLDPASGIDVEDVHVDGGALVEDLDKARARFLDRAETLRRNAIEAIVPAWKARIHALKRAAAQAVADGGENAMIAAEAGANGQTSAARAALILAAAAAADAAIEAIEGQAMALKAALQAASDGDAMRALLAAL